MEIYERVVEFVKITCKSNSNTKKIPANLAVNKIGKYLYNHLDGAYRYKTSANNCDVYFILLYQDGDEVEEMHINLNITTYQNKIRVNVIEVTPEEKTLGYACYEPELIQIDLELAKQKIFNKVVKQVCRAYKDVDFVF